MSEIMKVREVWQMEEWMQIIQRRQESGLSIKKCCDEHKISERQYYYWQNKIRTSIVEKCQPTLFQVELPDERNTNGYSGPGRVIIRFRDAEIELDAHDAESVTVFLRALKSL